MIIIIMIIIIMIIIIQSGSLSFLNNGKIV